MDAKLRSSKGYFIFTLIAGSILLVFTLFVTFRFEKAILYLGEKPYKWTDNPSVWFAELLSWFRNVSIMCVAACLGRLSNIRKRPWTLSDGKAMAWASVAMGSILLANGIYELHVYHGRELYDFETPIFSSTCGTVVFDWFMYLPIAFAAVEIAGGMWLLYRLYLKKTTEE